MIVTADLHTHSAASDSQYTPSQLVQLAKNWRIETLALTAHGTLDGKFGLHIAGGSDFHGERVKPDIQISTLKVDLSWLYS